MVFSVSCSVDALYVMTAQPPQLWLKKRLVLQIHVLLLLLTLLFMAQPLKDKGYKKASPVDPDRKTLQDLQDPRSEVSCWPCNGRHTPSINGGNASGTWVKCSVCALRVQYTPRAGSPGSLTMKADPIFVKGALEFLQSEMRADQLPNYNLVEKAYALMECQDRLTAARNRVKDLESDHQNIQQTLLNWVKADPSMPKMSQKAPAASQPSQADEIFQHLTPEEVEQLTRLAKGRMASETPIQEVEDEDVEVVENRQDR